MPRANPDRLLTPEERAESRARAAKKAAETRRLNKEAEEQKAREADEAAAQAGEKAKERAAPFMDGEAIRAAVEKGLKSMRSQVAKKLQAFALTADEKAQADAFAKECTVSEMEVFLISSGAEACLAKYGDMLSGKWAPEIMLGGGILVTLLGQRRLNAEAQAIFSDWKRKRHTPKPDGER